LFSPKKELDLNPHACAAQILRQILVRNANQSVLAGPFVSRAQGTFTLIRRESRHRLSGREKESRCQGMRSILHAADRSAALRNAWGFSIELGPALRDEAKNLAGFAWTEVRRCG